MTFDADLYLDQLQEMSGKPPMHSDQTMDLIYQYFEETPPEEIRATVDEISALGTGLLHEWPADLIPGNFDDLPLGPINTWLLYPRCQTCGERSCNHFHGEGEI